MISKRNFICSFCFICASFFINVSNIVSSYDNDCVPVHTNGFSRGRVQIVCYERWVDDYSNGINYLWTKYLSIGDGNDSIMRFRMNRNFYQNDPQWDVFPDETRNLTIWIDDHERLALAFSELEISRELDLHRDYDIINSKRSCLNFTDFLGIGFLQFPFLHHKYSEFGIKYAYWQHFAVFLLQPTIDNPRTEVTNV